MAPRNAVLRPIPLLIIGVGNCYRSDDGVGLLIVRRVRAGVPPPVSVREVSGAGATQIEAWQGAEMFILCDAVRSGAEPGTIHRLDAARHPIPIGFFSSSTYAFSVAEALELARALGQLPKHLLIFGIEGADFAVGTTLSPRVARAAQPVIREVRAAVQATLG